MQGFENRFTFTVPSILEFHVMKSVNQLSSSNNKINSHACTHTQVGCASLSQEMKPAFCYVYSTHS